MEDTGRALVRLDNPLDVARMEDDALATATMDDDTRTNSSVRVVVVYS